MTAASLHEQVLVITGREQRKRMAQTLHRSQETCSSQA